MELDEQRQQRKIPLITVILIAVNVLVYLYTEWKGSSLDTDFMIQTGAMYGPDFFEGQQYYRILTCFFLHFGVEHLMRNMLGLLVWGYALENVIGRGWFGFLYLFSGVCAGFISVYYSYYIENTAQGTVSCGASGAIYGLMGAYVLMLLLQGRKKMKREVFYFLIFLVICLYTDMNDPGIDYMAHVGGFAAGIITCIFMRAMKYIIYIERDR